MGQNVHFELLKKHVTALWDWAAHQSFGLDQNIAITADRYVEEKHEEFASHISTDSFLPEQLSEASFELKQAQPVQQRIIQTRTQTDLEEGIHRRRFNHSDTPPTRSMISAWLSHHFAIHPTSSLY